MTWKCCIYRGGGGRLVKIGDICSNHTSLIDPTKHKGQVNYIGLENIESNTGNLIGDYISQFNDIKSTKNSFTENCILYGKLRPNLNKVYFSKLNGICSTDILVLKPNNKVVIPKLLYQYLLSDNFNQKVLATVSGQQLPRTSWNKIQNLKLPLPPLDTQTQIIAQIETLENQIQTAQAIMDKATDRKKTVLERYLN